MVDDRQGHFNQKYYISDRMYDNSHNHHHDGSITRRTYELGSNEVYLRPSKKQYEYNHKRHSEKSPYMLRSFQD
jgi:hypothetical protein